MIKFDCSHSRNFIKEHELEHFGAQVKLAHEMLHVIQKTQLPYVEDKNEREWQAYTEMLFHHHFRTVPDAPDFNRKQFCEKALEYYNRMGEGSELQQKYAGEKQKVEQLLGTFH